MRARGERKRERERQREKESVYVGVQECTKQSKCERKRGQRVCVEESVAWGKKSLVEE